MQFDPAHLSALSAILRHGSFEAAARVLGVTGPAISQRIRALEDRLGGPVLTRSTPPQATALGQRLALHADRLRLLEDELAQDLHQNTRSQIRIAVNADSLDTWLLPALAGLDLEIDLVVDDQTRSADWLRRGEVSAAITDQAKPVQGCDVVALGSLRYIATANPDFTRRHLPDGPTAAALQSAPMLRYSTKDRIQHDWAAKMCGTNITPPLITLPSTRGFVEACILGLGWGLNPAPLVASHLADGSLIALSDTPWDTPLYWQISRLAKRPLEAMTKAIRREAKATLVS